MLLMVPEGFNKGAYNFMKIANLQATYISATRMTSYNSNYDVLQQHQNDGCYCSSNAPVTIMQRKYIMSQSVICQLHHPYKPLEHIKYFPSCGSI